MPEQFNKLKQTLNIKKHNFANKFIKPILNGNSMRFQKENKRGICKYQHIQIVRFSQNSMYTSKNILVTRVPMSLCTRSL